MAGIASKIWTDDLVALVHRCERGDPEAALLREIHTLLANGPKDLCEPIAQAIPRGELDRLIECGASESAALRLLGACGYMVSAGAGSQAIVTVFFPASKTEWTFNARTIAIAAVGALATGLSEQVRP